MLGLGCEEFPPEECRVDEQPCETDLYKILKNLAIEQGREGNWDNVSALKEFWSVLSDMEIDTVADITGPSMFLNTVEELMDDVDGFNPGLRLLFARALRPGTPSGFVWPQPPAEHQQHQHAAGQKTRPKAPQWDTTPKFTPMALKHDVPVPSLRSMGVFNGIMSPVETGLKLHDRKGYTVINERIYSAAQCHPYLQGRAACEKRHLSMEGVGFSPI